MANEERSKELERLKGRTPTPTTAATTTTTATTTAEPAKKSGSNRDNTAPEASNVTAAATSADDDNFKANVEAEVTHLGAASEQSHVDGSVVLLVELAFCCSRHCSAYAMHQ